jgi:hypothetical protein
MPTNARVQEALEHAQKVSDLYGLNILGNSLSLIEKALADEAQRVEEEHDEPRDLSEVWMDYGEDVLRDDSQSSSGHMSDRDNEVCDAECRELIEVVVEECSGIEEVRAVLQATKEDE